MFLGRGTLPLCRNCRRLQPAGTSSHCILMAGLRSPDTALPHWVCSNRWCRAPNYRFCMMAKCHYTVDSKLGAAHSRQIGEGRWPGLLDEAGDVVIGSVDVHEQWRFVTRPRKVYACCMASSNRSRAALSLTCVLWAELLTSLAMWLPSVKMQCLNPCKQNYDGGYWYFFQNGIIMQCWGNVISRVLL